MTATAAQPYRWAVLGGIWLLYFCFGLIVAAMAPLVHTITDELGLSHSAMGSVLGAWPLVYIASAIPCGVLLDRLGPTRGLFLAALVIAASAGLRAVATDWTSLFLAVGVFGLGGPLISIGAPKVISLWFEGRDRGTAMGIYITGPAIGSVAALSLTHSVLMPLAGGSWRAVLVFHAGFGLASGLAWLAIAAHPANRALERRLAAEPKRPQARVFAALVRLRAVQILLAMSVGIFFFNHGLNNWLPEILRAGGMSAVAAGYWASIPTAVGIAGALVIPRLAVPERRLAVLLALFFCAGAATLLIHGSAPEILVPGLILQGIARSSMMTIAMLILVETPEVGPRNAGAAGGLFFSAAEVGGVLGPLSIGYLSDATGSFGPALDMLTGVCAAMVALGFALRRVSGSRAAAGDPA